MLRPIRGEYVETRTCGIIYTMVVGGDRTGWSCPVAGGQVVPVTVARSYAPCGASELKPHSEPECNVASRYAPYGASILKPRIRRDETGGGELRPIRGE